MRDLTLKQKEKINELKCEMFRELDNIKEKKYIPNSLDCGKTFESSKIIHKYNEKIKNVADDN